jgi:ElaB/YqjD/DUF883 family membrane-anchored ribosome-binding protein
MNAPFASAAAIPTVDARFEELFDGVDDLIKRVADTENPEIRRIRAKVHASMIVAKSAYQVRAHAVPHAAPREDATREHATEDFPDDSGPAMGVALLVGVGLGVIMSSQP